MKKGYIDRHRAWVGRLKRNLSQPDKVLTFEHASGAAYPVAYLLKSYDLAQTKTWGRQNVEVNIANNRGASRSYNVPSMLADDPWVGDLWDTRSPEEMEQVFFLGYFSGVDYLYHEYPFLIQIGDAFQPNRWGQKYLDFARFSARHPRRGRQIARLAIMRGFGDTWDKIYTQYTPGGWGDPKNRRTNDETIRDYHLLNLFLPHFGTEYQTDPYRFCTGTPFGPVDMVPWDTPSEKLKAYDLIVYCGINAMDDEQYRRLKAYVAQGGTLVLTVGQLQMPGKNPREILPAARNDDAFLGVRLDRSLKFVGRQAPLVRGSISGLVSNYCDLAAPQDRVLARTATGAPAIIRQHFGKGSVYLFATEYLSQVSDEVTFSLLAELAGPARLLTCDPPSDWLEYTASEKGPALLLGMFNHGRIRSPSGNGPDQGAWHGVVTLDLRKFPRWRRQKLEAYRVDFTDPDFRLTPLPLTSDSKTASVQCAVDLRSELIVGPLGATKDLFFQAGN